MFRQNALLFCIFEYFRIIRLGSSQLCLFQYALFWTGFSKRQATARGRATAPPVSHMAQGLVGERTGPSPNLDKREGSKGPVPAARYGGASYKQGNPNTTQKQATQSLSAWTISISPDVVRPVALLYMVGRWVIGSTCRVLYVLLLMQYRCCYNSTAVHPNA